MVPIFVLENFKILLRVIHMTRHSSKSNKLKNENPVGSKVGHVTIQNERFTNMSQGTM